VVAGVIRDRELLGHLTNRSALREQDLSLLKLVDDLLCGVSLSWHLCLTPLFASAYVHYNAGSIWGEQVRLLLFGQYFHHLVFSFTSILSQHNEHSLEVFFNLGLGKRILEI